MQSPGKSRYATAPQEAVNSAQGGRLPPPKAIRKADRTRVSLRPAREREADPPSRIGLKQDQPVKIDPAWQIGTLGQLRAAVPKPQAEGFQLIPLGLYKPLGPIALREESSRPVRLCWTSARKIRAMRCFFGPSVRKRLRIGERAKARRGLGGQPQSRKPNRLETWLARTGRHFQSPWRDPSHLCCGHGRLGCRSVSEKERIALSLARKPLWLPAPARAKEPGSLALDCNRRGSSSAAFVLLPTW